MAASKQISFDSVRRVLTSLFDDLVRAGQEPTTTVLAYGVEPAPAEIAGHLNLPAGTEVATIRRLRSSGGQPLAVMTNYLPVALVKLVVHPVLVLMVGLAAIRWGVPLSPFALKVMVLVAARARIRSWLLLAVAGLAFVPAMLGYGGYDTPAGRAAASRRGGASLQDGFLRATQCFSNGVPRSAATKYLGPRDDRPGDPRVGRIPNP